MQSINQDSISLSDGRRIADRRRRHSLLSPRGWGIGGRRRMHRRNQDQLGSYQDFYPPGLIYAILGILMLSVLDAAFTLNLLQMGAMEINSFMAVLIERDVQLFVNAKLALTALGLIFLVVHANFALFNKLRVKHVIHTLLISYTMLISYELYLFQIIPGS